MRAYSAAYLDHVVEQQGKLFDLIAQINPAMDLCDFINTYMASKTRNAIDRSQAYVSTMDAPELWEYFSETERYHLIRQTEGVTVDGFFPMWLGEFYAYFQWYYNIPSAEILQQLPFSTMRRLYLGLRDLSINLAVEKVGAELQM